MGEKFEVPNGVLYAVDSHGNKVMAIGEIKDVTFSTIKPPLGIMPKHVWDNKRKLELAGAIKRYVSEGIEVPVGWVEEYNDLTG